ncbi:MAG: hypothetical protein VKL39_24205, partial [Leptolyngbyaceae bacterium]|nr:hypothetical protein [Leptolyngbyaceae bacterium]
RVNELKAVMAKKGYAFFEAGDYNLNIIAIRENDLFENTFSDKLLVPYKVNGQWQILELNWTTIAGTLGRGGEKNPLTGRETGTGVDGVAVIVEGQYRRALQWKSNGWRYPFVRYLHQIQPFNYYRDNNRDGKITRDKIYSGIYQTHLHPMSPRGVLSAFVNFWGAAWSQGCMGAPEPEFRKLDRLITQAIKARPDLGNVFTLTLLHRNDFNG